MERKEEKNKALEKAIEQRKNTEALLDALLKFLRSFREEEEGGGRETMVCKKCRTGLDANQARIVRVGEKLLILECLKCGFETLWWLID